MTRTATISAFPTNDACILYASFDNDSNDDDFEQDDIVDDSCPSETDEAVKRPLVKRAKPPSPRIFGTCKLGRAFEKPSYQGPSGLRKLISRNERGWGNRRAYEAYFPGDKLL